MRCAIAFTRISRRRAHSNSLARIARPAAMVNHPGPGSASIATPAVSRPKPAATLTSRVALLPLRSRQLPPPLERAIATPARLGARGCRTPAAHRGCRWAGAEFHAGHPENFPLRQVPLQEMAGFQRHTSCLSTRREALNGGADLRNAVRTDAGCAGCDDCRRCGVTCVAWREGRATGDGFPAGARVSVTPPHFVHP